MKLRDPDFLHTLARRTRPYSGRLWLLAGVLVVGFALHGFRDWKARDYAVEVTDYGAVRAAASYAEGQFLLVSTESHAVKSGIEVRTVQFDADRLWLVRNRNGRLFWAIQPSRPAVR